MRTQHKTIGRNLNPSNISPVQQKSREEYIRIFQEFDVDNSGSISKSQIMKVLKACEIEINEEEADDLINEIDADGGGELEQDQFIQFLKKEDQVKQYSLEEYRQLFNFITKQKNTKSKAKLSRKEVKEVAEEEVEEKEEEVEEQGGESGEEQEEDQDQYEDETIGFEELKAIFEKLGEKVTNSEISKMILMADLNKDGRIHFEEFYRIMKIV